MTIRSNDERAQVKRALAVSLEKLGTDLLEVAAAFTNVGERVLSKQFTELASRVASISVEVERL